MDNLIAELALTKPYSRTSLEKAVRNMRFTAALHERELREEWIPGLLRAAVDMSIAGIPSGEALILALPPASEAIKVEREEFDLIRGANK